MSRMPGWLDQQAHVLIVPNPGHVPHFLKQTHIRFDFIQSEQDSWMDPVAIPQG
jgi:hypothetical protein